MDDLGRHNQERWDALARAGCSFSQPLLDLDQESAQRCIDREGFLGDVAGLEVLGLAASGGQQSVAFPFLGARLTVLDFSEAQLALDREALARHGLDARLEQGDMRDLSRFDDDSFDLVWQAFSLNFVPEVDEILRQVARVLRPGGRYRVEITNPFIHGTWNESWNGQGYLLAGPYAEAAEVIQDRDWTFTDDDGRERRVEGPREFRHTLASLINGMASVDLHVIAMWEDRVVDADDPPGSWSHFKAFSAPFFSFLARLSGPGGA